MVDFTEIGKFYNDNFDASAVTKLTNGDYIVAWDAGSVSSPSIAFQRFTADGQALTQILYVPGASGTAVAASPSVLALPNGAFAVGSYQDYGARNFSYAVYGNDNKLISGRQYFGEPGWSYGKDNLAYTNGYVASASHSEAGGGGGNDGQGNWDVNFFVNDLAGNRVFSGKVATNNFNAQINPEVIALADGTRFLVAWADQSYQLDSSGFGLYGRVFSTATMSFVTAPFLINQITDGSQLGLSQGLSLAAMPDGGFGAYWINDSQAGGVNVLSGVIKGRVFNQVNGSYVAATNEFAIGANTLGNRNYVDVDQKPNGDMLAVFTVVDGAGTHLIGQVIAKNGAVLVPEFVISNAVDIQSKPTVSWLDNGSAVVVWTQGNTSSAASGNRNVVSKIIPTNLLGGGANNADFTEIGKFYNDNFDASAVTKLTNGDYIVAWDAGSVSSPSIAFQRFTADGQALTQILYVPGASGTAVAASPSVLALPNGAFAVGSYQDYGARNFSYAVYGNDNKLISGRQYFGEPGWSYGKDNLAYTNGYVASASHSEAGGGGGNDGQGNWDVNFFVNDLAGNRVFSGKVATNNFNAQINPEVIALADGTRFLVAWADQSYQLDSSGFGLYGRVFSTATMSFVTAPFLINQITDGSQLGLSQGLSLAAMPDGGFGAYWINDSQAGGVNVLSGVIKGRVFNQVNGSYVAATNEFAIGANTLGNRNYVDVDQKPNGDMLAVFTVVDGAGTHLIGQVIAKNGAVLVPEFVISNAVDIQSKPTVSWLDNGSAVVVWTQGNTSSAASGNRNVVSKIIPTNLLGGGANNAPSITSDGGGAIAALSVAENTTAVTTVVATDPDASTILSYSITGGPDAAVFQINALTGAINFKALPDFEAPTDIGRNNIYDITVQVSDGILNDTQALTITVFDALKNYMGTLNDDYLFGSVGSDEIYGYAGNDSLIGRVGNDQIDGGAGVDTAVVSGNRSAYTLTQTSTGIWSVTGPDGTDTLSNIEYLRFDDQTLRLLPGTGTTVNFVADSPSNYMAAIRDFDGNNLGAASGWKRIGSADVNGDGDVDQIFVNREIGRFAEVGTASDGKVYFSDHGWAGETRVVGIYIDPLVQSGEVVAGSDFDSQRRFQNDLFIDNISKVLGAEDYDRDGLQEVYFALTDGTAYLHAYMHADGNIQYANYQSQQQVIDYLTNNGWTTAAYAGWFG